jgi:hypothetical protein
MKRMARRPKLLLLDAGAVFGALEHDAWDVLTDCYKVVVPTIVLEEVQFYVSRETGRRVDVDPGEWVSARRIERYEASAADLASTLSVINVPDGPEIPHLPPDRDEGIRNGRGVRECRWSGDSSHGTPGSIPHGQVPRRSPAGGRVFEAARSKIPAPIRRRTPAEGL